MSALSTLITPVRPRCPRQLRWRRLVQSPLRVLVVAAALLSLAGCGSSDNGVATKSANQILAATRTAAQTARSVHLIANSRITHGGSFTLNARLAKDQGWATVSFLGTSMRVIRTGETVYVKGNKVFAARLESALGTKVPANTWLKGTVKGVLAQTSALTDITRELPLLLSGSGKAATGAATKLNGQPAITLKLMRRLYTGTLYVATTGQPYPLKLVKADPSQVTGFSETGQATFTAWNDPVTVTPPANAVDITQLQHTKRGH